MQSGVNKQEKNFSKTTKLHKPGGQVQFVVFDKFTSACYIKLQEKSFNYFLIKYKKKHHRKSRQTKL